MSGYVEPYEDFDGFWWMRDAAGEQCGPYDSLREAATALRESRIEALSRGLTLERALEIEFIADETCRVWGTINPGEGLSCKDAAIVAGRSLCARGYAETDEDGRLLVFAARQWLAAARRLVGA